MIFIENIVLAWKLHQVLRRVFEPCFARMANMKTIKYFGMLAIAGCMSASAFAATTWGVGAFLDGANAGTAQAVSATAWSTTGTGSTLQSACIHNYGTSGYGIVNIQEANPCTNGTTTGEHAADNNGATDLFLLEFASAVTLTSVKIGWNGTDDYSADSDLSVLAYTGSTPPSPSMSGKTLSGLLSSGWSVVGNYANVGKNVEPDVANINTSSSSSWWIVSAYNSAFGTTSTNGGALGNGNDYFKLLSVAGNVKPPDNKVPEPGSIVLLGMGLLGMMALRRRREA
jgi:hypothetical protein